MRLRLSVVFFTTFAIFTLLALFVSPARADIPVGTLQPNDLLLNKSGVVSVYSGADGHYKGDIVSRDVGPISDSWGITIGPDGNLYLCDYFASSVKRYNGTTGTYVDDFVISGTGGLGAPVGLAFLPDGNLYVVDNGQTGILRFNGTSGAYIDTPVPSNTPDLGFPQDVVFGADGKLYISTFATNAILRYDPQTGLTETFVQPGSGGQGSARQFAFGPDGNLYVTSQETDSIKRYSGVDGHYIDDFVASGSGGLSNVLGLAFGPDGNLYTTSNSNNILRFNGTTGAFLDVFVAGDGASATYILFNKGVTQTGNSVAVTPIPTTSLTFDTISQPGQTVVTPLNSDTASLPANFEVSTSTGGVATYFDINSTATYSGAVELSIVYDPAQFPYVAGTWTDGQPFLIHDPGRTGAWADNATLNWVTVHGADVTIDGNHIINGVDSVNHKVYGRTTSLSPFAVVRRHVFSWSGVLQPVNADGSSVFKLGSTIPVKFRLTGADAAITNLKARLYVSQADSVEPTAVNEAVSTAAADSGNMFRYTGGQYIFNLSTKNLSKGTWYLRIDLGDGTNNVVRFKLK